MSWPFESYFRDYDLNKPELKLMTKNERAVIAINTAAARVAELWCVVDPGHVPMITYLKRLERKLREQANELESRCNKESGS